MEDLTREFVNMSSYCFVCTGAANVTYNAAMHRDILETISYELFFKRQFCI